MHCTKSVARVRMSRSKVKVTGDRKKEKIGILFGSRSLGCGPRAAFFRERSSGARPSASSTPVGKSAHVV